MKKASMAGQFYPADKTELMGQVDGFLEKVEKKNLIGAVVPHAGYDFSGAVAGKVYSLLPEKKDFIILAVNHRGFGSRISFSKEDFETPLGIVKNNKALGEMILEKLKKAELDVGVNEEAFQGENSLETQLPFLQITQKKAKIIPILISRLDYDECVKVAEVLSGFVDENVFLLVSSDFTHYGSAYGFVPFVKNHKQNLKELDNLIILEILSKNSKLFYEKASKSTVCGMYGVAVLTEIAKMKNLKPKLIEYKTSGDVTGDYENAVGYAGVVFNL